MIMITMIMMIMIMVMMIIIIRQLLQLLFIVVIVVVVYDQQMILAKILKMCLMGLITLAWKAQISKKLL